MFPSKKQPEPLDPDRLVPVLVWQSIAQYEMACQVLEAEGIPFDRGNAAEQGAILGLSHPIPVAYLKVRLGDFERARDLLASTIGGGVAPPR